MIIHPGERISVAHAFGELTSSEAEKNLLVNGKKNNNSLFYPGDRIDVFLELPGFTRVSLRYPDFLVDGGEEYTYGQRVGIRGKLAYGYALGHIYCSRSYGEGIELLRATKSFWIPKGGGELRPDVLGISARVNYSSKDTKLSILDPIDNLKVDYSKSNVKRAEISSRVGSLTLYGEFANGIGITLPSGGCELIDLSSVSSTYCVDIKSNGAIGLIELPNCSMQYISLDINAPFSLKQRPKTTFYLPFGFATGYHIVSPRGAYANSNAQCITDEDGKRLDNTEIKIAKSYRLNFSSALKRLYPNLAKYDRYYYLPNETVKFSLGNPTENNKRVVPNSIPGKVVIKDSDISISGKIETGYIVKFVNTSIADQLVWPSEGSRVTKPSNPTKSGYRFAGWFAGWFADEQLTQRFDFTKQISSNTNIYPQWQRQYSVLFNYNYAGAPLASKKWTDSNKPIAQPTDPTRSGYIFKGWHTDKLNHSPFNFSTPITGGLTLYAHWGEEVVITLNDKNGLPTRTHIAAKGYALDPMPEPVNRSGFVFTGWFTDEECTVPYDLLKLVQGPFTLYAGWEAGYNVTLVYGNGLPNEVVQVEQDGKLSLEFKQHGMQIVEGWYYDAEYTQPFEAGTPINSDMTLYAKWRDLQNFQVTFETGEGGSSVPAQVVTEGASAMLPPEPTRAGYTFETWYDNPEYAGTPFNFSQLITADITLYAKWLEGENVEVKYTVTFETNGGSEIEPVEVLKGEAVARPNPAPTREGHTFDGWFSDLACTQPYDFNQKVTYSLTLYAGWIADKVTITFNSRGGSAVVAQVLDWGTPLAKPTDPTLAGQVFYAWYEDDGAWQRPWYFGSGVKSSLTLYARWVEEGTELLFPVRFETFGGSTIESVEVVKGQPVEKPRAFPSKVKHVFREWCSDETLTTPYDFAQPVTSPIAIFARFEAVAPVESDPLPNARIYPNPANQLVRIDGIENATRIHIYSITGQRLQTYQPAGSPELRVDVSHLREGFYLVVIEAKGAQKTLKLMVR